MLRAASSAVSAMANEQAESPRSAAVRATAEPAEAAMLPARPCSSDFEGLTEEALGGFHIPRRQCHPAEVILRPRRRPRQALLVQDPPSVLEERAGLFDLPSGEGELSGGHHADRLAERLESAIGWSVVPKIRREPLGRHDPIR